MNSPLIATEDAQILEPATTPEVVETEHSATTQASDASTTAASTASSDAAPAISILTGPIAQTVTLLPATAAIQPPSGIVMKAISELRAHEENAKTYGDTDNIADLIKSVGAFGILEPLLVTKDGRIIGGHRRFRAARKLEIEEVPVRVFDSEDDIDILNALLEHNRQRIKSKVQISAEALLQLRIERALATRRKSNAGKAEVANLPPANKGKARDAVGKKLGISPRTVDKAVKTSEAITKLREEGKTEEADKIETATNKSFDSGYKAAVESGAIPEPKTKKKGKASNKATQDGPPADLQPRPETTPEHTSEPSAAQPPSAVSKPSANGSDKALTYADHVITFLRGNEAKALSDHERRDWGKALDQIATCREVLKF